MSIQNRSAHPFYLGAFAVVLALLFAAPKPATAQSNDLNVYGFFQTQYTYAIEKIDDNEGGYSSFRVPQLNVFFAKDIGSSFSAFVNTEFINSYNSGEDWGAVRLGEAWVRYEYGRALKVKGGLLIPKFNNLNEIKNRTPLLPYITRPYVYEQSYGSLFDNAAYVPQRAYVQAYGALPAGPVQLDYAAYAGNSEPGYIVGGNASYPVSGTDTTFSKLFGGRIGLRYETLKVGVSGTLDETNMRQLNFFGNPLPVGLGDVDRYRIGADLSFDIFNFFAEGEYISVIHNMSDEQNAQWTALTEQSPMAPFLGKDLDQSFYYGMLGYEITDKLSAYALYNSITDNQIAFFDQGLTSLGGGITYRPVFPILLKAGYSRSTVRGDYEFTGNHISVAASVTF